MPDPATVLGTVMLSGTQLKQASRDFARDVAKEQEEIRRGHDRWYHAVPFRLAAGVPQSFNEVSGAAARWFDLVTVPVGGAAQIYVNFKAGMVLMPPTDPTYPGRPQAGEWRAVNNAGGPFGAMQCTQVQVITLLAVGGPVDGVLYLGGDKDALPTG